MLETKEYKDGQLDFGGVSLAEIADQVGTPVFVYWDDPILDAIAQYKAGFGEMPHQVHYALKANSCLAVLRLIQSTKIGVDVVSGWELKKALLAGFPPSAVIFSGVGKTREEVDFAIASKIGSIHIESGEEFELVDARANAAGREVNIAIRVNPGIATHTHAHTATGMPIHKFGVPVEDLPTLYARIRQSTKVRARGLAAHLGSQISDVATFERLAGQLANLADQFSSPDSRLDYLDIGGGLAVAYRPEDVPIPIESFVRYIASLVVRRGYRILVEPGRSIVAQAGIMLTRVIYRKKTSHRVFVVVDAAMNDLIRPALYNAYHEIVPVDFRDPSGARELVDVLGPVCESGDFFAKDRSMPVTPAGSLLAIRGTGAYGRTMSSNYNCRPRAAEVLIQGRRWQVVQRRETFDDLLRCESETPT
jgi:diaminopimelate decarboxylase